MRFYDFVGNDGAKELLAGAFDSGRVPHAFLIDGPAGSGRKMLAGIIAAAAVCESEGEKPCGRCRQCVNAFGGHHPDIALYTGTGAARSFSVDTVRSIRLAAYVAPNDAQHKVYILADAEQMTEQAQNALLKILEEPPAFTLFVLTCDGRSRILPTVLSRAQLITLGPVREEQAVEALLRRVEKNGETLSRQEALRASQLSGCLIGRAAEGLASGAFAEVSRLCADFAQAVCGSRPYEFLRLSGRLESNKALAAAFYGVLPELLRDAAVLKTAEGRQPTLLSGCGEEARLLASRLPLARIVRLTDTALWMRAQADRYANATLLLTAAFARLWQDAHGRPAVG